MTWHIARKERRRVLHVDFQAKKKRNSKRQLQSDVPSLRSGARCGLKNVRTMKIAANHTAEWVMTVGLGCHCGLGGVCKPGL
jgi:hypothetical protein